jgi:hypothetical protein
MEIREALFERAINEQQVHGILSDLWRGEAGMFFAAWTFESRGPYRRLSA